jgi:CheY-like chemotaxis protein
MDGLSKLLSALASLAWPLLFAAVLFQLRDPIRTLIDSARGRKFTIKVAGNELTMEEASEQQRVILSDLQNRIAELQKHVEPIVNVENVVHDASVGTPKIVLWVDDRPRNNSYLVAAMVERGLRVDIALSTDEALTEFSDILYDFVISDMGRPEGEKAGIDLVRKLRARNPKIPIFIFCGSWAAQKLRAEALQAGATEITSSSTTLMTLLPS